MLMFANEILDTAAVMRMTGRLDASEADQLPGAFQKVFEERKCVVFDLSELEFLDSTGLGMMIFCLRYAQEREGKIVLQVVPGRVATVLEITRVQRIFDIHPCREEALAALGA